MYIFSTKILSRESKVMLQSAGHTIEEHNFITTTSLLTEQDTNWINGLAQQKLTVIFTSVNAVLAVAERLLFQPKWKIFCIAGKTKNTIEKLFPQTQIIDTAINGALLASKITTQQNTNNITFFCGNKRLNTIPTILAQAGITLLEQLVYQTTYTPITLKKKYDQYMFFSPTGVESFMQKNHLPNNAHSIAIGSSTAQALMPYCNKIHTCAFPSEKDAIQQCLTII